MNQLEIIKYLVKQNPRGEAQLGRVKRQIAKKSKLRTLSNITLLKFYRQAVKKKKIKVDKNLEKLLKTREIRTLSGVAPVAVLTKPYPCPGKCVFCPSEKEMPKSYLSNEPAVMRAIGTKFDPYKQVRARIDALEMTGHNTDKIELIIMGGTWSYLPRVYQDRFTRECFRACNTTSRPRMKNEKLKIKNNLNLLKKEQKRNEKARHRIVGLTLETRPDYINLKEIKRMRELGCTKVELGIQAVDDKILKLNKRGNTVQQIVEATKSLKDAGFKIVYHIMPNLPGSSPAKDVKMYQELFNNSDFQPDMVKIYPCVVTKDSEIYRWWKKGKFKPYSDKQLFKALLKMKQVTPPYVRIIRLIRDIPAESIMAGSKVSNLRQGLQKELARRGVKCRCIRCREIRNLKSETGNWKLEIRKYEASGGVEYFLSFDDVKQDKLLAFLRLRLSKSIAPSESLARGLRRGSKGELNINNTFSSFQRQSPLSGDSDGAPKSQMSDVFPELKNAAIIREVHTYGEAAAVSEKGKVQHLGLGKRLIKEAEKVAKDNGYKKMAVIAAVGTREYYKKFGYKLVGTYMVKSF